MRRTSFKGLVAAGLVATSVASSTTVVSASDMFLKITGVKGESQDSKHKDAIDVLSWSWGTSTGTGKVKRGTVAPQCIQDLALTKYVDASTPQLIMLGVMGQTAKEATLSVWKTAGDGTQHEYLVIKMTDVLVSSYQTGGSAGSEQALVDQVVLSFSTIDGEYRRQSPDGKTMDTVTFSIDTPCTQ